MVRRIKMTAKLQGIINIPGDKSISHRAVMLGALSQGTTEIKGFLKSKDCLSTVECMRKLGINIDIAENNVIINGQGLWGLEEPTEILDVGNSGTTIRLLIGILAGQNFTSILTGDESIRKRPMGRVVEPLQKMGAEILGRKNNNLAPLAVKGGNLKKIVYSTPVASAQVKSSILLAALFSEGWTEVIEPAVSRNHTELMLKSFGADIVEEGRRIKVKGKPNLIGQNIIIPGDISSAAFFLVAGAITSDSSIIIKDVGLNPTRTGIIDVLQEMGAEINIIKNTPAGCEEWGDIKIESSKLKGIKIGGDMIPRLIDEIPILAVAAIFAEGITEIRDAEELKVKESNRLNTIAQELSKMGARIEELPDGLRIYGGQILQGTRVYSHRDHRIAMSLAVAGLKAEGETVLEGAEDIDISFPGFFETLAKIL